MMATPDERRYVRALDAAGRPAWAERKGQVLELLTAAPWEPGSAPTGAVLPSAGARLLAPAEPTKIVALGFNYKDLFFSQGALSNPNEPPSYDVPGFEPLVFLKGPNAVADPDADISIPSWTEEVWIEVELAVVIGRRARNLRDRESARAAVFGATIGNDLSTLNIYRRDWHLARSKSLDGFCPLGPELVAGFRDDGRVMTASINGRRTQSSKTSSRILDTLESVAMVSRLMTLEPGDVILTGTPAGARQSMVRPGDEAVMEIAGLGVLRNRFVREED